MVAQDILGMQLVNIILRIILNRSDFLDHNLLFFFNVSRPKTRMMEEVG